MTRWWFLAGVIAGADRLPHRGRLRDRPDRRRPAAARRRRRRLLARVARPGPSRGRASALAQLLLVGLLIAVVVTAVAGSAHAARPATGPVRPARLAVHNAAAASTLMISFVGWEAVAPLAGRLRAGQLSRASGSRSP